jgi:phospholipid transport system substrate-binding protein
MRKALTTLLLLLLAAGLAHAQTAPDQLVKDVAREVLTLLKSEKDYQGNPKKLADLVEEKVVPYFNFNRMTALAMGRNWSRATPEQQKALVSEFKSLLVRTYSGALGNYRNNVIEYKPLRMAAGDTEVTVRTQVVQPGGQPVPIDYAMEKTAGGWKAFDVTVAGVSLVTNYREEFGAIVKDQGVDGLIKALSSKNKG